MAAAAAELPVELRRGLELLDRHEIGRRANGTHESKGYIYWRIADVLVDQGLAEQLPTLTPDELGDYKITDAGRARLAGRST